MSAQDSRNPIDLIQRSRLYDALELPLEIAADAVEQTRFIIDTVAERTASVSDQAIEKIVCPRAGRKSEVDTMRELRELRRSISTRDLQDRVKTPSARRDDESSLALLLIWLGLYFNGTPYPELWQTIADRMRDTGGSIPRSYMYVAYGMVYRSQRRRMHASPGALFTVVETSVLVDANAHKTITVLDSTELNANATNSFREAFKSLSESGETKKAMAVFAERLARLYCTMQIWWYVLSGGEISVLHLRNSLKLDTGCADFIGKLLRSENQRLVSVAATDLDRAIANRSLRPELCVLGSEQGVVRDRNSLLGNPFGRAADSEPLQRLRSDFSAALEKLSEKNCPFISNKEDKRASRS